MLLRKLACAGVLLAFSVGLVCADEFTARIKKVDNGKISLTKFKKGEKTGEDATLDVAANVKVVAGKRNEETKKIDAGDPIEGGLKNEMFTTIGEKGVFARVITDDDGKKITEIRVLKRKKAE